MRNTKRLSLPTEITGLAYHLVRDGLITAELADIAMQQTELAFTHYLVQTNILSSESLADYCVATFDMPVFDLSDYQPIDGIINADMIQRYRILPLYRDQNTLYLGMTNPIDHALMTTIGFQTGLHIRSLLITEKALQNVIHQHYRPNELNLKLESTLSKIIPFEDQPRTEIIEEQDEPVSEFVDKLIKDAITEQVSDIHIEPFEQECRIRFRRDGLLYEAAIIPSHLAARVTTRLKIIANLNIAERRLPQDGRIQLLNDTNTDIRINTCPMLFGEKIVLRLLNSKKINLDMDALGFTDAQKNIFLQTLSQPQGLILVTGPTGSGKTVTLYSALHYLNQIEKNISSVEDPIEIELKGVNQVHVNPRIGLDFNAILRTFLRQDPDIIMIGEIRDGTTATLALQAAQTGHLVLSTLHTNNAVETLGRLQSMGLATYQIVNSLSLIIAQRLVRKLCNACKQPDYLTNEELENVIVYRAVGCDHCYQGYLGRVGIFEFLIMTEDIAQHLLSGGNITQFFMQLKKPHPSSISLWEVGIEKIRQGITSLAEVNRVLGNRIKHANSP